MATYLVVVQGGKPVSQGLEVSVSWSGFFSGISKYKTGTSGYVTVDEDLIKGSSAKAEHIFVQNPKGGLSLTFDDVVIKKGDRHILDLDFAHR